MYSFRRSQKGFTLIEMLVVIAIIAILVAIIIPTVSGSTVRAAAATNAANLRSVEAMVKTALIEDTNLYSDLVDAGQTIDRPEDWIIDGLFGSGSTDFLNQQLATVTAANGSITFSNGKTLSGLPTAKQMSCGGYTVAEGTPVSLYFTENNVVAFYGKLSVANFADIAEDGIFDAGAHICTDVTSEDGGIRADGICDICGSVMGSQGSTSSKPHDCKDEKFEQSGYSGLVGGVLNFFMQYGFSKDGICDEAGCNTVVPHTYNETTFFGSTFCRICGNNADHQCHK